MPTVSDFNQVIINYFSIIPVYIAFFMVMTSAFNQDVKALYWLSCVSIAIFIIKLVLENAVPRTPIVFDKFIAQPIIPQVSIFNNYPEFSISTFFIMYTLIYLLLSMSVNKDWNYWVIMWFVVLYLIDFFSKHYIPLLGRFIGTVIGGLFGFSVFLFAKKFAPDKLLYFTVDASNRKYCSRPKKQQFKCYVYKGGQLISST